MRYSSHRLTSIASMALVALTLALGAGCDDQGTTQNQNKPAEQPKAATQPLIKVAQIADWCPEHGVPESVCTRCNASLIPAFKAKGDWDEAHGLPKSQCFECDPSLKEKFAAAYKEKYGKEPPPMGEGEHHHDHDHEHEDEGKGEKGS